jgi:SAM-dependent methyltransferase/ribosomal protein S18 acetylase RimI-like enzyme
VDFGRIVIFVRDLREPLDDAPGDAEFEVRLGLRHEAQVVLADYRGAEGESLARERLRNGDQCIVALDREGRPLHARWVTTAVTPIPELAQAIAVAPGEAYFYDGYTLREVRGRGVDAAVRRHIFKLLREAGFVRVYSYVRSGNEAAVRAAARLQRPVGRAYYVRLRGLRPLVIARGEAKRLVIETTRPAQPAAADRELRAQAWRRWFEGWLEQPLEKRSTGFDAMPPEYFDSVAAYVAGTLALDPARDRTLDVGCDSAMVSRRVAPACRRFVGVDFIPGLVRDVPAGAVNAREGPASFLAADGRSLPFRAGVFDKVLCCAMIHVLPSPEDGVAVIDELLRVCRPGGQVLVAAVPDRRKRWREYVDAWRREGGAGKLRLIVRLLLPGWLARGLRRLPGLAPASHQVILYYDLRGIQARLRARGFTCEIRDFPAEFWSRDFRRTRSNLLIGIPAADPPAH